MITDPWNPGQLLYNQGMPLKCEREKEKDIKKTETCVLIWVCACNNSIHFFFAWRSIIIFWGALFPVLPRGHGQWNHRQRRATESGIRWRIVPRWIIPIYINYIYISFKIHVVSSPITTNQHPQRMAIDFIFVDWRLTVDVLSSIWVYNIYFYKNIYIYIYTYLSLIGSWRWIPLCFG